MKRPKGRAPGTGRGGALAAVVWLLTLLLCASTGARATDYFVSASGSPGGDGSVAGPWDLQTAFNHPATVQPGDTLWLRGGSYVSASRVSPAGTFSNTVFNCKLNGTSNAPIVLRQYPGERAIINGGIYGGGSWYWLWGFEITNTDPLRDVPNQFARSWGVFLVGRGCRLINLVVHDCGHPGIGFWDGVGDGGEVYGCILWGNGFYDHSFTPTDIRGGGIYGQNQFGTRYVRDNVFFKQFTQGIHLYATETFVNGFQVDGNVFFNNGAGTFNLFLGTVQQPMSGNAVLNNITYFSPGRNGTGVRLGYEALHNDAITVRSNLVVNGTVGLYIGETTTGTVTDNSIFGATDRVVQLQRTGNFSSFDFNWNNNRYITTVSKPFIYADQTGLLSFGAWKTNTGYDASSTFTAGSLTGVKTIVRPNQYEPGRAHLVVFNWTTQSTVNVDLSAAGLPVGAAYEIRDVQNLLAPPVITGIHDGTPVALPMNLTVAAPLVGNVTHISNAHSGSEFNTFLLLPLAPNNKVTVLSESFEGAFPGNWSVGDANPAGPSAYWAPVGAAFGAGDAHGGRSKGYCAGAGYGGSPSAPTYRDAMTSQMQQTINLSGLTNATLSFWYKIPSLPGCCDLASVYLDATLIWSRSSPSNIWQEAVISLNPYVGAARTLKFEFTSDAGGVAEGWYLDDVLVTGYMRTNKFIVTAADDGGPGSLRQAILDANSNGGGFITFNIATGGLQVITLLSPLPALTAPMNIDARTQPGYSSAPLVHLDGALVTGDGLTMEGGYATVQGLALHGFASGTALVLRNGGNNTIQRCSVTTNLAAVLLDQSSNNTLGSDTAPAGNVIAYNGGNGIRVLSGINNRIAANSIYANGSSGLSLGTSAGANDAGDADTGPNQLQNRPLVTDATSLGRITGTLNSATNQDFLVQFFANAACDPSGFGEGESWLGSLPVTTDQNGNAAFTFFFSPIPGRDFITATATDSGGNTSEFSSCQQIRLIPTVSIATTDAVAAEPSNPGAFTVTRVGPLDTDLSVAYTLGGTASHGTDYGLLTGTVLIPAGTNSAIIPISPLDDSLAELSETVIATLSSNAEYIIGSPKTATVTLLDNDLPTVSIRNTAINESNSGTNNANFVLTLSQPISLTVTVNYSTGDGSALAGVDYVGKTGTVTFAPGTTNQTLSVGVLGETLLEEDEFFVVNLTSAVNATLGGNRAVGTIYNDDAPPPPPPGAPGALFFDGINDSVSVPDSASLNITNGITVEAWINRSVIGVQHCIVEKTGCAAGQGGYVLRVTANNKILFGTRDDCNVGTSVNGATSLAANTWYHVAGVFDGAQLRVYVNGVLDGTLPTTRSPKSGNTPLKIGERATGGTPFNGMLDEVRIWNGARTAPQIQAGMNRVLNGAPSGLAGYWRLDDGAGLTAADSSGNGNLGTLVNGPVWVLATSPVAQRVTVTTSPASDLAATSATLNGSLETDGYAAVAHYQWGLTPTLGNATAPQSFGPGANTVAVASALNGLLPGTTYYYRLLAANASGATNFGMILSFVTPGPPSVVTGPASDIAGTGATLHGSVIPGNLVTMTYFEWGLSKNYENATLPVSVDAGSSAVPVASVLGGLSPATIYHYRLIGFNDQGIDVGTDAAFTTAQPPGVVTGPAGDVTFNSATLNALVNPNGAESRACFHWGLTTNYDHTTGWQSVGADTDNIAINETILGLSFSRAYHFRVTASNNTGVVFGGDVTFTTSLPPPPVPGFAGAPTIGLRPLTVIFTNLSTGLATNFNWIFGDDTSDSAASPVHTFANAGTYSVSLIATGPGGSAALLRTNYVVVTNPPPVAAFSAGPRSGPVPLLVNFTNLTTGVATNFAWDFGDNSSSSEVNPIKTYSSVGAFTVRLTAVGPGGISFEEKGIYITITNPPPVAAFSGSPTQGAVPLTVGFSNLTTGVATDFVWALGDGSTSAAANPSRTYTNVGTYTVSLTAFGPGGSSADLKVGYITVTNPPPVAAFGGSPTNGSLPLTVNFTNLTVGVATNFAWDFGDNTFSSAIHPAKTYTNVGSYTVQMTAAGPGGGSTNVRVSFVTVTNPPPLAVFSAGPTQGVVPLTVSFTNSTLGVTTGFAWDFGDNTFSSAPFPVKTYTNAGIFTVSLTATGPGGIHTSTRTNFIVAIQLPPVAAFTGAPTNGFAPWTVNFTNLTTGIATNFNWTFGDGTMGSVINPAKTYINAGVFTVSLTATGPGGSHVSTRTNYIVVTNLPPAPLAAFTGSPTSGAAPLFVSFTNRTTGVATNFVWDFGDGTASSSVNPTKIYTNLGTYTVSLRAIGPGGTTAFIQPGYIAVNLASAPRVAVQLDGVNDFLNVPDSPNLRIVGPFTIEAWIKRATNNTQHSIVEKYGCSGLGGYVLRVASTNRLVFGPRDDCNQGTSVTGNTILASNTWYHVAGTWDGVTLRVYVNGALDGSLPNNRPPRSGTTPLKIGERGNGGTPFQGLIDEVRLWSLARTTAQLQTNMGQCLLGNEAGLAGYWRLNEGAGLLAFDSTTNANIATLMNGPLWGTSDAPVTCLLPAPAPSGGGGGGPVAFPLAPPSLGITANGDNRSFLITVTAVPVRRYLLEVSADLIDWSPLRMFGSPSGTFEYSVEMAPEAPARFYRVREP